MADRDATQDERLHELFRALREGVIRVPGDFSRRVGAALGELSRGWDTDQPPFSSIVVKLAVEAFNMLGSPLRDRRRHAEPGEEADDGRNDSR